MWRRHSAIVLMTALVLGACGGSTKAASTKKIDPVADRALAHAAVLTAADLSGYTANLFKKSGDIPESAIKQFAKCTNVGVTIFDDTPGAQAVHSPDFDKDRVSLSSSVQIDPTQSNVDQVWNEIRTAGVEPCLQQLLQAALKAAAPIGVKLGDTKLTKFKVGVGNRSVGYAATMSTSSHGGHLALYVDLLFVARNRARIDLTAFSDGLPFDRATEIALTRTMYDRIGTKAR